MPSEHGPQATVGVLPQTFPRATDPTPWLGGDGLTQNPPLPAPHWRPHQPSSPTCSSSLVIAYDFCRSLPGGRLLSELCRLTPTPPPSL